MGIEPPEGIWDGFDPSLLALPALEGDSLGKPVKIPWLVLKSRGKRHGGTMGTPPGCCCCWGLGFWGCWGGFGVQQSARGVS